MKKLFILLFGLTLHVGYAEDAPLPFDDPAALPASVARAPQPIIGIQHGESTKISAKKSVKGKRGAVYVKADKDKRVLAHKTVLGKKMAKQATTPKLVKKSVSAKPAKSKVAKLRKG